MSKPQTLCRRGRFDIRGLKVAAALLFLLHGDLRKVVVASSAIAVKIQRLTVCTLACGVQARAWGVSRTGV